jgi:hypothetical protein
MPSFTWTVRLRFWVLTVTDTTLPGLCAATCLDRAAALGVACPPTAVITSPLVISARAAGLPGSTAATTTPWIPVSHVRGRPGPERIAERAERAGRIRGLGAVDDCYRYRRFAARSGGRQCGLELVHRGQRAILISGAVIDPVLLRLRQGAGAQVLALGWHCYHSSLRSAWLTGGVLSVSRRVLRAGLARRGFEPVDFGLQPAGLFLEFEYPADAGEVEPVGGQGHDLVQPADVVGAVAAGPAGAAPRV